MGERERGGEADRFVTVARAVAVAPPPGRGGCIVYRPRPPRRPLPQALAGSASLRRRRPSLVGRLKGMPAPIGGHDASLPMKKNPNGRRDVHAWPPDLARPRRGAAPVRVSQARPAPARPSVPSGPIAPTGSQAPAAAVRFGRCVHPCRPAERARSVLPLPLSLCLSMILPTLTRQGDKRSGARLKHASA
jgi:hypothetical protein